MSGQVWETNTAGGYMYSGELSDVLRNALQPMTRFIQHCDADDFTDKGLHAGQAYQWNVYSDVGKQGGRIAENQRMPETGFTITQKSGTVYEFGNSVPYTGVLDNRSRHPVKQIINKALRNDCVKSFEIEAHAQFQATPLTVTYNSSALEFREDGAFTSGTPSGIASIDNDAVKGVSDEMKERDMPVWSDGDYRCIGRPKSFRLFKNELEQLHQHVSEGYGKMLNGEVGRHWEGVRFFEQTFIADISTSIQEAFFFGEDTVIEAIVCPPEMRGKLPGDYGRDKGVAWFAEEGFNIVHDVAADARIYRWGGAA
ncbi:MAG: hypothetical protein GY815_04205 [Gammaproteobacteria bacterium]|nr:hypothetical protein [Gammaproteobacteria bacterium]